MTGEDTGEFLTPNAAWEQLQETASELRKNLNAMRQSLEAVAQRYHNSWHNPQYARPPHPDPLSFMDCEYVYCREIATVLRMTADTNRTAGTTHTT